MLTATTTMTERRPSAGNLSSVPPDGDPLVAACIAGTPGAGDRLFGAYAPAIRETLVRFLARRCHGRLDLAEDLTHEVFVALLRDDARKLRTFEGRDGCSFLGWLRVVAVRMSIDTLRRDRRVQWLDDDTPAMEEVRRTVRSAEADPADRVQGAAALAHLRDGIARLGPKDRLLVELHLGRGASLEQVAAALGVSMNAAYVRKSRVLERLRRLVEEER